MNNVSLVPNLVSWTKYLTHDTAREMEWEDIFIGGYIYFCSVKLYGARAIGSFYFNYVRLLDILSQFLPCLPCRSPISL